MKILPEAIGCVVSAARVKRVVDASGVRYTFQMRETLLLVSTRCSRILSSLSGE